MQLWPGQYVGVNMQLTIQHNAVVIPQIRCAVRPERQLRICGADGNVTSADREVDRQIGDLAVITSGLKGGERVITQVSRNMRPGL